MELLEELIGELYLETDRDKGKVLDIYASMFRNCNRCRLASSRTNMVFGWGNPYARLVFIGEAPGREEDLRGKPFVGKAGQLLSKILRELGIDRERDVYIGNILKCRPPGNRDPKDDEIKACFPHLKFQINVIAPKIIVALGRYSASVLTGKPIERVMSMYRGKMVRSILGVDILPTYHPAAALRNPRLEGFIRQDIKKAWDYIRSS